MMIPECHLILIFSSNIISLPLAFVRSGNVNLNNGKVYGASFNGFDWSRTINSSIYSYRLDFYPTDVVLNRTDRWAGFSLCCLYLYREFTATQNPSLRRGFD